jgi:hypothetical protein
MVTVYHGNAILGTVPENDIFCIAVLHFDVFECFELRCVVVLVHVRYLMVG